MDESIQITHINHICADYLERPIHGRKMHDHSAVAAKKRKKLAPSYRLAPSQTRQIASPPYRCTTATHRNWKNKQKHDLKRKLVFDAPNASSKAGNEATPSKKQKSTMMNLLYLFLEINNILKRWRLLGKPV
ncbi:hypothetical protein M9H77_32030 [Catharanthus roseus]|uniref:Uncharacterized protein n=1 Tax=Catharanthus roseus TaxID=4058 RepID=A0ACC0A459_CATRO|nr:hypothetical protein M9H77_32030 [Catharanthus roseus]